MISPISQHTPITIFPAGSIPITSEFLQIQEQVQERRASVHEFNNVAPRPPLASSASGGHIVEYPRSTVETALMMSAGYVDREPGEVILSPPIEAQRERPSESERLAMLSGVQEAEEEEEKQKGKKELRSQDTDKQ